MDVPAPLLSDREIAVTTWGSGISAVAAARRWSLVGDAGGSVEVDSVWIHLDPEGRPTRIGEGFEAFREAAQGRSASTRLTLPGPAVGAPVTLWPLRASDVDLMGHVNNAAYWKAVEDRLHAREPDLQCPYRARLEYRHPIDLGESVGLAEFGEDGAYAAGFVSEGVVKAVALVEPLG
jgi:acyl-ACP thioesterase